MGWDIYAHIERIISDSRVHSFASHIDFGRNYQFFNFLMRLELDGVQTGKRGVPEKLGSIANSSYWTKVVDEKPKWSIDGYSLRADAEEYVARGESIWKPHENPKYQKEWISIPDSYGASWLMMSELNQATEMFYAKYPEHKPYHSLDAALAAMNVLGENSRLAYWFW
jgi:hypothetical protein